MVQEVEGLGQRQGQAGGRLAAVQEYDLQHFAAQKVALHGGKEHLSARRRERASEPSRLLLPGACSTIPPDALTFALNRRLRRNSMEAYKVTKPVDRTDTDLLVNEQLLEGARVFAIWKRPV